MNGAAAARIRIHGIAIRTPLIRLNAGENVWLKLESLQPIGSFKIRGAANAMAQLSPEALQKGVLTASAGNMAQGVAFCARRLGIPATIVAPETAPRTKLDAVERLGGRVILAPVAAWWNCFETRAWPGVDATFVHAFDDPEVMAGNGTIALEILEDCPEAAAVIVPWGGGGLACGIAAVFAERAPQVRVYAAEAATSAPLTAAWRAGRPVRIAPQPSFVDGIGSSTVLPAMYERARTLLAGVLVADQPAIVAAVKLAAERNRVILEGAAAAALAAAIALPGPGPTIAIVSGGNIDLDTLVRLLG